MTNKRAAGALPVLQGSPCPAPRQKSGNSLFSPAAPLLLAPAQAYGGGVVMITHNQEFYSALCNESWLCADGRLHASGGQAHSKEATKFEVQEETTDAFGNVIKVCLCLWSFTGRNSWAWCAVTRHDRCASLLLWCCRSRGHRRPT